MNQKIYKIEPLLYNSFEKTLKELIKFVLSDFEVENITYNLSFNPDLVKVGERSFTTKFQKPEYIYATFNFCSEFGWTNSGGHEFCKCILKDKSKILINWSIGTDSKKIEKLDIKFMRMLKLKKFENS